MGIIDSGFQVVIIHSNIWEKLGTPMKHKQVMFMELANGLENATMGQFLAFVSQLVKSASTAQSKWSEMPLSNVSSVYLHIPCIYQVPGVPRQECTPLIH